MAKIQELLDNLLHKKLGRDVRQSIHDSIEQCYKDATGHPESVAGVIEENKNMQKQLDSNINTINGRIDTILTGTVNTTKLVTVHSATIRNNSASDLTFKISSKDNETLKSIKDKSPTVINANVIAKALDGVAINGKGIPSSYNVESTNDEYVITVYSGSSSVVGQYVFMAVVTIAYEDIATDISSAELKDVRVGTDGTTYESAGEAVRQQIGSLKSDTSRIKKSLRTTYVDMNLFALGTINKDTGEEESSNKILRSIIDVNATEDITIKLPKGYQWNVAHWLAGKYRSDLWNENSWYQNLTIEKTTANYKYRILIRRSDGADITLSELIGVAETNREDLQSFDKIDDLKKKLNSYTEAAETSAQEAEQSKTAAETAAQQAAQSKTDIDNIKSDIEEAAKGENVTQIQQNMNDISSLKEDISNKITKFYASNQGETHITDSDSGKIQDMMIYGKSEQKQYKGINLLPPDTKPNEYVEVSIPKGSSVFLTTDGTPSNGGNLKFFNEDKTKSIWLGIDAGTTSAKRSLTIDAKYVQNLITASFDLSKICLGVGSEPIYEPYTGGIPSPSPDYPQEIKSVVNPTVKVTNKDGLKVQSVTLNNITLNAIPVSRGSNVTINGQQYVADYVDVERGKIVKCIEKYRISSGLKWIYEHSENDRFGAYGLNININPNFGENTLFTHYQNKPNGTGGFIAPGNIRLHNFQGFTDVTNFKEWLDKNESYAYFVKNTLEEIDLTTEEIQIFKELATYYPTTNISVNSEQLNGYTVFNYPISMANGWNYVKQQLNDNRNYIYDMDLQSAEAYVNSEYAVALTELEV